MFPSSLFQRQKAATSFHGEGITEGVTIGNSEGEGSDLQVKSLSSDCFHMKRGVPKVAHSA